MATAAMDMAADTAVVTATAAMVRRGLRLPRLWIWRRVRRGYGYRGYGYGGGYGYGYRPYYAPTVYSGGALLQTAGALGYGGYGCSAAYIPHGWHWHRASSC